MFFPCLPIWPLLSQEAILAHPCALSPRPPFHCPSQDKTDDHTKEDFNVIKHVKITHSLAYMGYAGKETAPGRQIKGKGHAGTLHLPGPCFAVTPMLFFTSLAGIHGTRGCA